MKSEATSHRAVNITLGHQGRRRRINIIMRTFIAAAIVTAVILGLVQGRCTLLRMLSEIPCHNSCLNACI